MSSLSAARADNYYYPREWRPELGSINQFQRSHPLGKRAKHVASDGVLVVRFEMPFDVWCLHCATHIGRGVRFNAKKRKCGMYFTTPLYEFALTCTHCQGAMVVRTNPANRSYDLVSGVRKKVDAIDVANNSDSVLIDTERLNAPHVAQMLQSDPFFRLEHEDADKRKAQQRTHALTALLVRNDASDKDNYASNAQLRAAFRSEKQRIKRREERGAQRGLTIPLLDTHADDVAAAKAVRFQRVARKTESSLRHERKAVVSTATDVSRSSNSSNKAHCLQAARAPPDSFQHFGDALGSHLHRLTVAKRARKQQQHLSKQQQESSGAKRCRAGSSAMALEARADKLLRW